MRLSVQELMEKYRHKLYAVAFNICKSQDDSDDVVRETLAFESTESVDLFNEEGVCRVQVQHEDITYYMTVYYQDGWHMNTDKFVD